MSFHIAALPTVPDITWDVLKAVNGRFVVFGYHAAGGNGYLAWSLTGETGTWNLSVLPAEPLATEGIPLTRWWTDIAYGNGVYVLIARRSHYYTTSTDLTTFATPVAIPTGDFVTSPRPYISAIAFGGGVFCVACESQDSFTFDGVSTWAAATSFDPPSGNGLTLVHDGTNFVAGRFNSFDDPPRYSPDGLAWYTSSVDTPYSYTGSRPAMIGTSLFLFTAGPVFKSEDHGATWALHSYTMMTYGSSSYPCPSANGLSGGMFVGEVPLYSMDDGETWWPQDLGYVMSTVFNSCGAVGDKYAVLDQDYPNQVVVGTPDTSAVQLNDDDTYTATLTSTRLFYVDVPLSATSATVTMVGAAANGDYFSYEAGQFTATYDYYSETVGADEVAVLAPGARYYIEAWTDLYLGSNEIEMHVEITYPDEFWTGFIGCEARNG